MNATPPQVEIAPLAAADIETVGALAREIWRAHYPSIISAAQIEYMLDERYAPSVLRAELERSGLWWDVLRAGGACKAFSSYLLTEHAGEMKLDKLYVHPDSQRCGYGGLLIERACVRARSQGCSRLVLAVNKHNANAIAAYHKHGFVIEQSVVKDIGGGFVMDDYIMVRSL
jgi:ribosomal protein S18 acetylase RimI-like enzyme